MEWHIADENGNVEMPKLTVKVKEKGYIKEHEFTESEEVLAMCVDIIAADVDESRGVYICEFSEPYMTITKVVENFWDCDGIVYAWTYVDKCPATPEQCGLYGEVTINKNDDCVEEK